jgi:hypothetical protein
VGLTLADRVRAIVGTDGSKLVEMWAAVAFGRIPQKSDDSSSQAMYIAALKDLAHRADLNHRLACSNFLALRGFGQPKQELEHTGEVALATTVIHQHVSS